MATTFKGTPLVLGADDGTTLQLADADGVYAERFYVENVAWFNGYVNSQYLNIDQWYDNSAVNLCAGANTNVMPAAARDVPSDPLTCLSFASSEWTFSKEINCEATLNVTLKGTDTAQATIYFELNGVKVRSFTTPLTSGAISTFCFSHGLFVHANDTFRVLSTPISGASLTALGNDSNGRSQTVIVFKYFA
jgi:hypothetical protein